MKNENLVLSAIFFLTIFCTNGQKNKLENPFETKGTLNSQFLYIEKSSSNYKEYKVISKEKLYKIRKSVLDSITQKNALLKDKQLENKQYLNKTQALEADLVNFKEQLETAKTNKNTLNVLGGEIHKNNYTLLGGIIISSLIGLAFFFFYKFYNSNLTTIESVKILKETQDEFEIYQKNSLKRQQEINRKLQDEIIKNRKE